MTIPPEDIAKVHSYRGKILQISKERIMELFIKQSETIPSDIAVTRFALPDSWIVADVFWNRGRNVFEFIVFSEEFPLLPLGEEYPRMYADDELLINTRKWECKELSKETPEEKEEKI